MPDENPLSTSATTRLYWHDDHCFENHAHVVATRTNFIAFDQTCFYPGGRGQPADSGTVTLSGGTILAINSAHAEDDLIWHVLETTTPTVVVGQPAHLRLNRERRLALARYHTVLHVLNTIALRDYAAWITGVQIGVDYSRIDFKWEGFSAAATEEVQHKVNSVLNAQRPLRSFYISEEEFNRRPDLLRTLEVKPPVIEGRVRVVEIEGFDAQACGGTHVPTTGDVGHFSVFRTENKGRINKRLYVRLNHGGA